MNLLLYKIKISCRLFVGFIVFFQGDFKNLKIRNEEYPCTY